MDSSGIYLSRIFLEFFPKHAYSNMTAEKFQIYSVKITGKYICKIESVHFYSCPQGKTFPQVFIIPPALPPPPHPNPQAEENYQFLLSNIF